MRQKSVKCYLFVLFYVNCYKIMLDRKELPYCWNSSIKLFFSNLGIKYKLSLFPFFILYCTHREISHMSFIAVFLLSQN